MEVEVEKDLEEILPGFMSRTQTVLQDAINKIQSVKEIEVVAHRLSGTAGGYGLVQLGEMAAKLEADCKNSAFSITDLKVKLGVMLDHLMQVKVIYK